MSGLFKTDAQERVPTGVNLSAAAKIYLRVFDVGLQNTFVYRWNFFIRSIFGILPLLGTVFIWGAIFEAKGQGINSFDYGSVVFYFLLVLFLQGLVTPTDDEWEVANDIREGQIGTFIVKPIDYVLYRFSLFCSNRLLYAAVTLPVVAVLFFCYRQYVVWPTDWFVWLITIWSTAMAALLQFFISLSIAFLAFWMLEISTVVFIIYSFEYFLSGQMFPIAFMPAVVRDVLVWLPFPYELSFPVVVFMERVHGAEIWSGLVIQAFWVVVTGLIAKGMWRIGLNYYETVGG
jgi:ABC-2 type transport system permease protein